MIRRKCLANLAIIFAIALGTSYGELPVEEFTGTLEKKKYQAQDYFAIKLDKPVLVNQKEVDEAQLLIFDELQLKQAQGKIGAKIWVKGTIWPAEPGFYYLDAAITPDQLKFQ